MNKRQFAWFAFVPVLAILSIPACNKENGGETKSTAAPTKMDAAEPQEKAQSATTSPEVQAILAKADAMDGATDHVVSKCGMCALRMNGSDAHASKVGDYDLHFCSDHCKESFDENTEKAVLAFNVE